MYLALGLALVFVSAAGLSGCGRKGVLDPPPGAALTEPGPAVANAPSVVSAQPSGPAAQDPAKSGFDAAGNPVAPPGPKKSFFLDFLLR
jgi:predicted small lipoprotein YifL